MILGIEDMNKQQSFEHSEQIRTFFTYLHRFEQSCFVVHIDPGSFCGKEEDSDGGIAYETMQMYIQELARDTAFLVQADIRIVLVFGYDSSDTPDLHRKSYPKGSEAHHLHTTPLQLCMQFLGFAKHFGCTALVGNWVSARASDEHPARKIDGKTHTIDVAKLNMLLDQFCIPVFPSVGWNKAGMLYKLDSKDLALSLAEQLRAEKLLFLTDRSLFRAFLAETDISAERSSVTLQELEVKRTRCGNAVETLIDWIARAIKRGVPRVHVIDAGMQGGILTETFSHAGSGCMVHSDVYEKIRPAQAEDIANIEHIVRPLEERGYLRKRSQGELGSMIEYTVIHETDGSVEACGALLPLSKTDAELAMLALAEGYELLGIGKKVVQFLLRRAKEAGYKRVFAFTRRSVDWFYTQGFRRASIDILEEQRKQRYIDSKSTSTVLVLIV